MTKPRDHDGGRLFDAWPEKYDSWFETPVGRLVKTYETKLLIDMLDPQPGESILDVGCGTGIFTNDVLACGAQVVGLDISHPMLLRAVQKNQHYGFIAVAGDMSALPFGDKSFDRVYSMTALEFVADGKKAAAELNRVVRPGGTVVLTTLNSLSPWAQRRRKKAAQGHELFGSMTFRSPAELADLAPEEPFIATAIHFLKDEEPGRIPHIEQVGRKQKKDTGAFVAAVWRRA